MSDEEEKREERLATVIAEIQDEVNRTGDFDRARWTGTHPEFRAEIERFFGFENFFESVLAPAETLAPTVPPPALDLGAFPIRRRLADGVFGPVYLLSGVGREAERELAILPLGLEPEVRERIGDLVEIARPQTIEGLGLPRRLDTFDEVPVLLCDHVGDRDLAGELGRLARGGRLAARDDGDEAAPEESWRLLDRGHRRQRACELAVDTSHLEPLLQLFTTWARILDEGHRAGVIHGGLAPVDMIVPSATGPASIRRPGCGPAASGMDPGELPPERRRWVAPELLRPRLGRPGYLCDVHGFGQVLGTALALDLPHWDEADEVVLERLSGAPLDVQSWLPPALPPALVEIVDACCQRDPRRRPARLDDVAARLQAIVRRLRWRRRRRWLAGGIAAAIVSGMFWIWLRG